MSIFKNAEIIQFIMRVEQNIAIEKKRYKLSSVRITLNI